MCLACVCSERSRIRTCRLLMLFSVFGATSSKIYLMLGYDMMACLQKYLDLVDTYDARLMPVLLMTTGSIGLVLNVFGLFLGFRSLYPMQRSQLIVHLFLHELGCGLVIVMITFAVSLSAIHQMRLDVTFRGGLLPSMQAYRNKSSVKMTFDKLQIEFKCCGNDGYTDWFQIPWINVAYLDSDDPEVSVRLRNGNYESDDVPYSCCDPAKARPCIVRHVHDDAMHFNYIHERDLTLYKGGCRDALMQRFNEGVLVPIFITGSLYLCMMGLVLTIERYLHTSMVSALEEGNPLLESRGYVSDCCIYVAEEVFGVILKSDSSKDENARPSVPVLLGSPPQPYLSTTKKLPIKST